MAPPVPHRDHSGPHLAAAFLCEKLLKETDGVSSAIRIVDRIAVQAAGSEAPEEMPSQEVRLTALLILKSGTARGRGKLKIAIENPSGQSGSLGEYPVFFEGEDRGVELVINLQLHLDLEGLYWIDLTYADTLLTRMPLRLIYQPARPPQGS